MAYVSRIAGLPVFGPPHYLFSSAYSGAAMKDLRFWAVCALIVAAGLLLLRRGKYETIVPSEPLSGIPNEIGGLTGVDQSIDPETLDVLGSGNFLTRVY